MNNHDRLIFPHHADRKPQKNAYKKQEHIIWHNVKAGHAIADQLNDSSQPFHRINRGEFTEHIYLFPLNSSNHVSHCYYIVFFRLSNNFLTFELKQRTQIFV